MPTTRWLFELRSLPHAALALAACAAGPAFAQSAANGQVLYQQRFTIPVSGPTSCEDCHGPAYIFRRTAGQISSAIAGNRGQVMGVLSFLTAQQVNDIAAYTSVAQPPPPPPPVSPPPAGSPPPATPLASPNPATLANTVVGSTSSVINVQFTNTAATNVAFATPTISAATGDTADFLVAAPTSGTQCIAGRVLAPGMSCSFGVQFSPQAAGSRAVTWTVNFMGSVAPRPLTITGSASATSAPPPAPAPAPTAPAPAPAANAPTSGGGGALGWIGLLGLASVTGVASGLRTPRRRTPTE